MLRRSSLPSPRSADRSTPLDCNPYAPPAAAPELKVEPKTAEWYLSRVQKTYRWMSFGMLAYIGFAAIAGILGNFHDGSLKLANVVAGSIWCALFIGLFAAMLKISYIAPDQFPRHYQSARWIGIIAGALFLPILGIPAFISLRRLTQYHQCLESRDE